MTVEAIEDVTDQLRADGHLTGDDENPEDRVYRIGTEASGRLIKVKTWHDLSASAHGREVYRVSGAAVGSNGKALRREDGTPAVYQQGRTVTAHADSETDLITDVEVARWECVRETACAHRLSLDAKTLTGVGTMKSPTEIPFEYAPPAPPVASQPAGAED